MSTGWIVFIIIAAVVVFALFASLSKNTVLLKRAIGIAMLVIPFAIFALIIRLWPSVPADPSGGEAAVKAAVAAASAVWKDVWPCTFCDAVPFEQRMILIVLLAGALGSTVHTATSYATYVGSRTFKTSWGWWYFLRIPIGMGLAVMLYFALRGGFFSPASSTDIQEVANPFGFVAIAAMAGMFSKQATDKLKEIFDGLFRTEEDSKRTDKFDAHPPTITKVEPETLAKGAAEAKLTITGTGFSAECVVLVSGDERKPEFDNATKLTLALAADDLKEAGTLTLQVKDPKHDNASSEEASVEVK